MLAGARRPASDQGESHDYINQFTSLTHDFTENETPPAPPVTALPR
jgi:hypothetical protein